jgi:hypothetical protein
VATAVEADQAGGNEIGVSFFRRVDHEPAFERRDLHPDRTEFVWSQQPTDEPMAAEGRIEPAVGTQARRADVMARPARDDDIAVRFADPGVGARIATWEVDDSEAVAAETGDRLPHRVEAEDGHVFGLDGTDDGTELRWDHHLPVGPEGRVEDARRGAHLDFLALVSGVRFRLEPQHQATVGLPRHDFEMRPRRFRRWVSDHPSTISERRVERSNRRSAGGRGEGRPEDDGGDHRHGKEDQKRSAHVRLKPAYPRSSGSDPVRWTWT